MEMSGNRWRERGEDEEGEEMWISCKTGWIASAPSFLPSVHPLTLSLLFLLILSLSLSHSRPLSLSLLPSFPIAVTLGGELAEGQGRARAINGPNVEGALIRTAREMPNEGDAMSTPVQLVKCQAVMISEKGFAGCRYFALFSDQHQIRTKVQNHAREAGD